MEAPDPFGALQLKFVEETIVYTGEQLHSLWAYRAFGLEGDSAVAFCGACGVTPEHMRDLEDLKAGSRIVSDHMLHFIIEHFGCDLQTAAWRQWVFMARMAEELNGLLGEPRIRRTASDLYDGERKLTVSIASVSPVSGLIHAGINISSRNTPVPARGLEDYGISARDFGRMMLEAYAQECAGIKRACCKVRPCP
ncbi:MAG: DUF366 family protein [Pseudomonadota bacterium]